MNIAPIKKRIASFIIDDLILSILIFVIFYNQLSALADMEALSQFMNNNFFIIASVKLLYHWVLVWQNGMTVGNFVLKIRVVDEDNGMLLMWHKALLRSFIRLFSEAAFYIGFLVAFLSPKVQTMHDKFSNAVVVDA
ncbi:MAG: RDD family protein [Campylobacterales bacterium]|nr:RDD family protein [Campylobacterales bacterium]